MNQTPNYQLSQWEATDKVQRVDFNEDNAKIDAALKAEADARRSADSVMNAALNTKGNLSVEFYNYIGTGTGGESGPCFIPFEGKTPFMVVLICGQNKNVFLFGTTSAQFPGVLCQVTWTKEGVSWYASNGKPADQLNSAGGNYRALLFYKLD